MTAKDYPVTLGYKATTAPYGTALRPYHKGIDYGCPAGTPVVVNGVQIGLSGATGFVTGAHLHVGRFVNGADTNPAGGFKFNNAVVSEIGYDINNGNFVRILADGASWVYCHLNSTNVTKGQVLKGGNMPSTVGTVEIDQMSWAYFGYGSPSNSQFTKDHLGEESNTFERFMFDHPNAVAYRKQVAEWRAKAEASGDPTTLAPGTYKVK